MTINDWESLEQCILTGTYSTIMNVPKNDNWNTSQEGTFADYCSMKEGDSIYFFHKRKVYGIGKLKDIVFDCKFLNYQGADVPKAYSKEEYEQRKPLLLYGDENNRCFCSFVPNPFFFKCGVDMDDVLMSNPDKLKIFRTMWKVSFIKVDEEESSALQDIILKRNEEFLYNKLENFTYNVKFHRYIEKRLSRVYRLSAYQLLLSARTKNSEKIRHEMAIEAALCDLLGKENDTLFGKWDYISHQVAASPFKPIDYMDKMDVFGYRYIQGYITISKYLVIEIKRDEATEDVVDQIMKYVDWINQEYAHGDYSMIDAYVVAADFSKDVVEKKEKQCVRNYTKGYRPTQACTWKCVKFIKYSYDGSKLIFREI